MRSQSPRPAQSRSTNPATKLEDRLADEARFLKFWLDKPLLAGAVSPSGRFLARMMARYVDPHAQGPIIELGPGTGAITEALIQRGVPSSRLILVEFDPAFCKLLQRRFPGVRVVQGDAYRLAATLRTFLDAPAAAIVSSLPLLTKPESQRLILLDEAFSLMDPQGAFIQFTYGVGSPMPRKLKEPAFQAEVSPPVWLNLPPARVWIYRQRPLADAVMRSGESFFDRLKIGTKKMRQDLKKEIAVAKARLQRQAGAARALEPKPALRLARGLIDLDKSRSS